MKWWRYIRTPFVWGWKKLVRIKYYLLAFILINFVVWLFCLPSNLFNDPTCTVLADEHGNILSARIADDGQWRFPPRKDVPYKFKKAIIQFEDRDFYSHMGFSFKAFGRAMMQNVRSGRVVSGGSTISMQTIRLSRKGKSRSIWEKLVEVYQATRMEWSYSKSDILAMYASYAPMGGNVVGLDAAAWRYFGRSADQLSWAEACTLAVLPNAPSLMHPGKNRDELIAKRNRLLNRLHEVGEIDDLELQLAISEPLPDAPPTLPNLAPHLMDRVVSSSKKGTWVQSTVRRSLQEEVRRVVDIHHDRLKENEIYNAAVLVLEVETGNVLAYVGNTKGDNPEHGYAVDVIRAPRSTGSILKPFLYGGVMDAGEMMPKQIIEDVPTIIAGYSPKNYNEQYDGMVPASNALARSLNVPIVKMLQDYGVQKFHRQLNRMGLSTVNRPSSDYGLSLVLGGAEASLWDLCAVYSNMAHTLNEYEKGEEAKFIAPSYELETIGNRSRENLLLSPGATWTTLNAMLEVTRPDEEAHWQQFSSSRKIAWKTGTSFGFRDAWAIGVTPKYVVGVWVGNADGEGRPGIIGVKAAAPILFDVFNHLPQTDWFHQPTDNMKLLEVCHHSGHRASDICTQVDSVWVPEQCVSTLACPYHQNIHLDGNGNRVNSSCMSALEMRTEPWFILPPIVEKFYRSKNPNYRPLPPYRDDCNMLEEINPIGVIYPKSQSKIYIPVQLDGTLSKTVFEASHRDQFAKLYWHLDDQFLGVTEGVHQMELIPIAGKHTLTLIDELGYQMSKTFEVYGKDE